ncbi:MAG: hypothetical protein N3A58_01125 [Spirochaetes bacterium]|nr:hypothetical protein [Spirochaetota bacterium]
MLLKKRFAERLKELIKLKNLSNKDIEVLERKKYIPLIEEIIGNGYIINDEKIKIYKKDKIIGIKIGNLIIKLIYDLTFDDNSKTMIIPLSIDEGDLLMVKLIDEKSDIESILNYIMSYLNEKEKNVVLENIKNVDEELYWKFSKNFPPITKISGILDDIVAKTCERMSNLELVSILSIMDGKERRKIYRNVSENRSIILQEELDYITYFTKSEIRKSLNKFYKLLQQFLNEN